MKIKKNESKFPLFQKKIVKMNNFNSKRINIFNSIKDHNKNRSNSHKYKNQKKKEMMILKKVLKIIGNKINKNSSRNLQRI